MMEEKCIILNKHTPERKQDLVTFEKGDVYGLDIYLATGEGKCKLTDFRTTVFKRALENTYILKSDAARKFFSEVNTRFPSLPFSMRSFDNVTTAKLGVKHCMEHNLLEPFEVHTLKDGELAVSFKATVAILPSGTFVLAGNKEFKPELYSNDKNVQDAELSALLALDMDLSKQKERSKFKSTSAATPEESKQ